jgi:ferredoxin
MARMFKVTFTRSGRTIDVAEDEPVLEAGLRAGLDLAHNCRQGMCKTCMVLVDGIIDQRNAYLITDEELAEGLALICVGRPRSDLRVDA